MAACATHHWNHMASGNVSDKNLTIYLSHRDDLAGTSVYGDYSSERSSATFSIRYDALVTPTTEVLFMTGNRAQFLVTRFVDFAAQGSYALFPIQSSGNPCLCPWFTSYLNLSAAAFVRNRVNEPGEVAILLQNSTNTHLYRLVHAF